MKKTDDTTMAVHAVIDTDGKHEVLFLIDLWKHLGSEATVGSKEHDGFLRLDVHADSLKAKVEESLETDDLQLSKEQAAMLMTLNKFGELVAMSLDTKEPKMEEDAVYTQAPESDTIH